MSQSSWNMRAWGLMPILANPIISSKFTNRATSHSLLGYSAQIFSKCVSNSNFTSFISRTKSCRFSPGRRGLLSPSSGLPLHYISFFAPCSNSRDLCRVSSSNPPCPCMHCLRSQPTLLSKQWPASSSVTSSGPYWNIPSTDSCFTSMRCYPITPYSSSYTSQCMVSITTSLWIGKYKTACSLAIPYVFQVETGHAPSSLHHITGTIHSFSTHSLPSRRRKWNNCWSLHIL